MALDETAADATTLCVFVTLMNGHTVTIDGLLPTNKLEDVIRRLALELREDETCLRLVHGAEALCGLEKSPLSDLGLEDGADLHALVEVIESRLDPDRLSMECVVKSSNLAGKAMQGLIHDYRLRRQTVEFALDAAESREARMNELLRLDKSGRGKELLAFESRDLYEERLQARTCAASGYGGQGCEVGGTRNEDVAGGAFFDWWCADCLREYEGNRRTVEFAEAASARREASFQKLVVEGEGICIGSKPKSSLDKELDAAFLLPACLDPFLSECQANLQREAAGEIHLGDTVKVRYGIWCDVDSRQCALAKGSIATVSKIDERSGDVLLVLQDSHREFIVPWKDLHRLEALDIPTLNQEKMSADSMAQIEKDQGSPLGDVRPDTDRDSDETDSDDDLDRSIVLDIGSYMCRIGFGGEDAPCRVFRNIVGLPKVPWMMQGVDDNNAVYIGDMAEAKRGVLNLTCPMQRGIVTDWDAMEKVWHHAFYNELRIDPSKYAVLVTEPVLNPRAHHERVASVMFETFRVQGLWFANSATLACTGFGRGHAMVVECGHCHTQIVPIWEGFPILHAVDRIDIGGKDVTDYLLRLLEARGVILETTAKTDIAGDIKEKLCFCQLQQASVPKHETIQHILLDGSRIDVGSERWECTEILFRKGLASQQAFGIPEAVFNSIMKCDIDLRKDFYTNVLLCGGSTLLPNFPERLRMELMSLAPASVNIRMISPPERKYLPWIGGSILACITVGQNQVTTRDSWNESGPESLRARVPLLL